MSTPDFDEVINRVGTHSAKWDHMEKLFGVSPDEGIPMWVADMDFRPPAAVQCALEAVVEKGVYGYFGDDANYRAAICWWMQNRHGWTVQPDWIFTTHGLVNGTGLCVETYTDPGDGVILFTPVYHAFARVIRMANREVVELPLVRDGQRFTMDFEAYEAKLTGREKMLILCSPHNPGGQVWSRQELEGVAAFARKHDLLIVSDEIHHDLVFPGQKHIAMPLIDGIEDRLVTMTAASKTFNLAGVHAGNVIIPNEALRERFAAKMGAFGISPNGFAPHMIAAAYSPEGAAWLDALIAYLAENARIFDEGVAKIPGLKSIPLEATYLAWVDFSGTGMSREEFTNRIEKTAKIAASHGDSFGTGGENFMRFNLATRRALVVEAVTRLQKAFADLQ
ncbi:MAG: cystathionine beta-lyase [Halocynthiibacter sp.]|jgi:cystathionine beta-lyase